MVGTISYFILFGIISIASGKPSRYDTEDSYKVTNEFELQQLLQLLANQGSDDRPSNYGENVPNTYQENRAGASQYYEKPRKVYHQKANPQQYYKSYGNSVEDKPNYNSLQTINQFLTQNGEKPDYNNAQNLLEELLSLNRNDKFKPLKISDENDNNVDEVLSLFDNLQTKPSDVEKYRVLSKSNGKKLKVKKLLLDANNYQPDAIFVEGKDGVLKLVENIGGSKAQYYNPDYYKNLDYKTFMGRNDKDEDSYNARDDQRCNGKNCARTNRAVNNKNRLRCKGKNCARSKTDVNDGDLTPDSKISAQKIKVNDELDAVVLGLSDVDHLLSNFYAPKSKQRTKKLRADKNVKLLQNVDLQSILNSKDNIANNPNVEAVVFDLTQVENGASIARQIKQLLSQDNEGSYDEYEDYGNLVEDNLKQGIYDLQQDVSADRANTQIIAHNENNNNVYLPQWLLREVVKSYDYASPVRSKSKSVLPSAKQQKARKHKNRAAKPLRVFRRNFEQDVGVPFHLEVEGLGQVNP